MFTYSLDRIFNETYGYLINNITKVDIDGNPITLYKIIKNEFPLKFYNLSCVGPIVDIHFKETLTIEEEDHLNMTVQQYQTIEV